MCRLLGLLSVRTTSVAAPLAGTEKCLWRQSFARRGNPQRDGWGLAWYRGAALSGDVNAAAPRLFLSPRPLAGQRPLLKKTAARATGRTFLFHLRRASNPRGLPLARLRGRRNLQPFRWGRWTFVHNGSIPYPDETARFLGPIRHRVRGLNDSEVLFWLVMRELRRRGSVAAAIRAARGVLRTVARRAGGPSARVHGGLNILMTDGDRLWAYAEAPARRRRASGALMTRAWPYFRLAVLTLEDRCWVASEPLWDGPRWRGLSSGRLLEARRMNGRVRWSVRRIV